MGHREDGNGRPEAACGEPDGGPDAAGDRRPLRAGPRGARRGETRRAHAAHKRAARDRRQCVGRSLFVRTAEQLWAKGDEPAEIDHDSFYILIPSFCVGELTKAFQIGFLVYLPFIAIDIIVSNILLAMGMMMVSPVTISLPFKLLLFVMIDGWTLLVQGLIRGYVL